jgi:hypothetical protein
MPLSLSFSVLNPPQGNAKEHQSRKEYEENENIINDDEHVGLYEPVC